MRCCEKPDAPYKSHLHPPWILTFNRNFMVHAVFQLLQASSDSHQSRKSGMDVKRKQDDESWKITERYLFNHMCGHRSILLPRFISHVRDYGCKKKIKLQKNSVNVQRVLSLCDVHGFDDRRFGVFWAHLSHTSACTFCASLSFYLCPWCVFV